MTAATNVIFCTEGYTVDGVFTGLLSRYILVLGLLSLDILVSDLPSFGEMDILDGNIDEGVNNK